MGKRGRRASNSSAFNCKPRSSSFPLAESNASVCAPLAFDATLLRETKTGQLRHWPVLIEGQKSTARVVFGSVGNDGATNRAARDWGAAFLKASRRAGAFSVSKRVNSRDIHCLQLSQ